ncbi:MAG: [Fe-Fe] hydrogenase large subunit C-terminal domain-containing protein [Oscillospiraceae bacterium]
MAEFFHSVTLDREKCKGCINCIKRCPTQAIRVRDGKASIITERCIDCGECIRICPHHAKRAIYDPPSVIESYPYPIALVPPSLYGQFNNMAETEIVLSALKEIGFKAVFDVGRAAELVSDATRRLLAQKVLPAPVVSTACPAVLRLIRVRFPHLIGHLLPLLAPVELAARLARQEALAAGVPKEEIGCVFITPCPAKVTAMRMPIGSERSEIDAAVAVKEIYPLLLGAMKQEASTEKPQTGRIGLGWGESGGEATGLVTTDEYLAADGIENVIKVLEDLEDEKYHNLDFVELDACAGGCVGGVLQVENPYIAKAKIKKLRRYMPVSLNHLGAEIPATMQWDTGLEYQPVMELGSTTQESFRNYEKREEIMEKLPGLDCGSCGAPTCEAFAEDVVKGFSYLKDCTVLMRRRMDAVLQAIELGEAGPAGAPKNEEKG